MGEIEEALRKKMNDSHGSVRSFARITGISYEKITYCLNRSIDNCSLGNVKKFCEILDLNLNLLAEGKVIHNYEVNDDDIKELIELYINLDKQGREDMKLQLKYLELRHNKRIIKENKQKEKKRKLEDQKNAK